MKKTDFDPLAYIENAFLDNQPEAEEQSAALPELGEYLDANGEKAKPRKFEKTEMRAPRPRRKGVASSPSPIDPALRAVWENLPKNVAFLFEFFDDEVTSHYYRGDFAETRQELMQRLLDPEITLEEASRLLGVCPATVRRYTNKNWLKHHRTAGGQRRFRLSDVVNFVNEHGRFPKD